MYRQCDFYIYKSSERRQKGQFPNLENGLIISIGSLLFSLMFYGHENELKTLSNLKKSIEEYIKCYNEERINVIRKGLSPLEYRQQSFSQL